MKFTLRNIGAIPSAEIELNGITLIAGENSSGKSTIEKSIFLAFSSLYNLPEYVQTQRVATVSRTLKNAGNELDVILKNLSGAKKRHRVKDTEKLQLNYSKTIVGSLPMGTSELTEYIKEYAIEHSAFYSVNRDVLLSSDSFGLWLENTVELIGSTTSSTDDEVGRSSITEAVRMFFSGQIVRFHSEKEPSFIMMQEGGKENRMSFRRTPKSVRDICSEVEMGVSIIKPAVFIDSPDVFDGIRGADQNDGRFIRNMVQLLLTPGTGLQSPTNKDIWNIFGSPSETVIEKDQNWKLAQNFYQMIEEIVQGHLAVTTSGRIQFIPENGNRAVEMANVSTGIKALSVLSYAMENGCISQGSVLILDEPEINLHPEWQLKYAEILVRLQKEMQLNILITTHSPYFVEALAAYSTRYGIKNKCKYYQSANTDKGIVVQNMTDDPRPIYEALARPFRKLEEIEDGIDNPTEVLA